MNQAASTLNRDNPWPGLATFEEADSAFFHGRGAESAELLQLVQRETLTVLFGRSGLGKTSLLNAGLYPLLRELDYLPVHVRLDHGDHAPPLAQQVLNRLHSACEDWQVQALHALDNAPPDAGNVTQTLWAYFHQTQCEFWSHRNRLLTPVIVFDQFEEIFTIGQEHANARARAEGFLAELAELVENRPPQALKQALAADPASASLYNLGRVGIKLVLSFREDFLAEMEALKDAMPSLMYNRLRLLAMDGAQAYAVVAEGGGSLLDNAEDHAVARCIMRLAWKNEPQPPVAWAQFGKIEIDPALLSVVCSELNVKRQQAQLAQITKPLLSGADREILSGFYERSMAGLDARVRAFVEDELINRRGYRDSHDYEDALALPGVGREAIAELVRRRLLRIDERQGKEQSRLELAHDVLTRVVAESRDQRQEREEAAKAAAEQAAAAEEARLQALAQARAAQAAQALAQAQEQAAAAALALAETREQAAHAEQAQARAQQVRNKTNARWLALGLVLLLVLAGVAVWQAIAARRATAEARQQQRKADQLLIHAKSLGLMTQADRFQDIQYDLALLLNLEALRLKSTSDAQAGLVRRFNSHPHLTAFLSKHQLFIDSTAFSPDGKLLASASWDHSVILWDVASRTPLATLTGHTNGVTSVVFSPDGKTLASSSYDKTVMLWDVASRTAQATLKGHTDSVRGVAFSPDGKVIASASHDQSVILWDVASRTALATLKEHIRDVTSVAFSPDGKTLASGSVDTTVILWDIASRTVLATLEDPNTHAIRKRSRIDTSVVFSPDGKLLASASEAQTVILWDVAKRTAMARLKEHSRQVTSIAFSPDGHSLATGSKDKSIILWNVANGNAMLTLSGHTSDITSITFSPDGNSFASGSADNNIILWDTTNLATLATLKEHKKGVKSVAFSPDGKSMATGSWDDTLILRDGVSGAALATLKGSTDGVTSLAFSPNGKSLIAGSLQNNGILWDVPNRTMLATLKAHTGSFRNATFSPDGKMLASNTDDNTVILWDVVSYKAIATLAGHSNFVSSVAFSPDSKSLASGSGDNTVILWDVANRARLATLNGHTSAVYSVTFSLDGKLLASGSIDKTIILWDVKSRKPLATLKGHTDGITSVAFSPDGNVLASGSQDHSIILWDTMSWASLATLNGHTGYVNSLAFRPDGKSLISGSEDKTVIQWNLDPSALATQACRTTNRNLSCEEWRQYIGPDTPYQKTCPTLPSPKACQ